MEWARSRRAGLLRAEPVRAKIWGLTNKLTWIRPNKIFFNHLIDVDYVNWISPEVLDVILNTQQRQSVADRTHVRDGLRGRTPVDIFKEKAGFCQSDCAWSQAHFKRVCAAHQASWPWRKCRGGSQCRKWAAQPTSWWRTWRHSREVRPAGRATCCKIYMPVSSLIQRGRWKDIDSVCTAFLCDCKQGVLKKKKVSVTRQGCHLYALLWLRRLTWRLGIRCMKAGEIDESVGCQEEIGDDWSNDIQIAYGTQKWIQRELQLCVWKKICV